MDNILTIALSKGTLLKPTIELLQQAGLPCEGITEDSRSMIFTFYNENINFITSIL